MRHTNATNNIKEESSGQVSSDKDLWREEQVVRVLYANARGAMIGSIANIAIVSYVLSNIYPTFEILTWFLTGQILNLVRWYVHSRYVKDHERLTSKSWLNLHRIFAFLSGSLYGLLAIFFFSSAEVLYQALVLFLVGGMGAAAVGTHGVDTLTYRLFLLPGLIPLIIRSLYEGTEVHNALALMLLLLAAVMFRAAKQTKDTMYENFDMSYSLHYRATHDGLVGLLNRDEFRNLFTLETSAFPVQGITTSIIFIDLDNFKKLNDTFGHQEGDKALVKIGEIIRHCIRKSDIAARFGGDEFMILVRSNDGNEAKMVGQKILHKIEEFQSELDERQKRQTQLGASIGIGYSSKPELDFDALLSTADKACYQAKQEGKGRVCLLEMSA